MSGSTRVEGGGDWWHVVFETPRISFAPPPSGHRSAERSYHDEHQRRFEDTIASLREPLDAYLASLSASFGLLPWNAPEGQSYSIPIPMAHALAGIQVKVRSALEPIRAERLSMKGRQAIHSILHRPAEPDHTCRFHLVRWPDGTIEDRGVAPVGCPTSELSVEAAEELVRRCAEIVAAAEREGLFHVDLLPDKVSLAMDGTVALLDYGTPPRERGTLGRMEKAGAPPEMCFDDFYAPPGSAPDWMAVQRYGLGRIARHWGVEVGERPAPDALLAQLEASAALDRWLHAKWGRPEPPVMRPRGHWNVEERLLNGAKGALRPCLECGKPMSLGACGPAFRREEKGPPRRMTIVCHTCAQAIWSAQDRMFVIKLALVVIAAALSLFWYL